MSDPTRWKEAFTKSSAYLFIFQTISQDKFFLNRCHLSFSMWRIQVKRRQWVDWLHVLLLQGRDKREKGPARLTASPEASSQGLGAVFWAPFQLRALFLFAMMNVTHTCTHILWCFSWAFNKIFNCWQFSLAIRPAIPLNEVLNEPGLQSDPTQMFALSLYVYEVWEIFLCTL